MMTMKSQMLAVALAVAMLAAVALADGSHGSGEEAKKRQNVHKMFEHSPTTPPPTEANVTYEYPVIDALQNICSNVLVGQDQKDFQAWLSSIQIQMASLSANISITVDEIVVMVTYSLKKFCKDHDSVKKAILHQDLNDASHVRWGSPKDLFFVVIEIQYEVISPVIIVNNATDSCPLMDAINSSAQASGDLIIESRCQSLIGQIHSIVKSSSLNETQQLAQIYDLIMGQYSDILSFLLTIDIQGFGPCESFLDVGKVHSNLFKKKVYMAGKSRNDSPFLKDLDDLCNSCVQNGNPFPNVTECVTLTQMYGQINLTFQSSSDILERMENVSMIYFNFRNLCPWLEDIELAGYGDDFDALEFDSNFCHNENICDCVEPPPPSSTTVPVTTPAVTTPAATTPAATTPAATTPAATTPAATTTAAFSCSGSGRSNAISLFIVSINVTYMSWSAPACQQYGSPSWHSLCQQNFDTTFAKLKQCVQTSLYPTLASEVNCIIGAFNAWSAMNVTIKAQMYATQLQGCGCTVNDFVSCGTM